jgi:hypothetical protein
MSVGRNVIESTTTQKQKAAACEILIQKVEDVNHETKRDSVVKRINTQYTKAQEIGS